MPSLDEFRKLILAEPANQEVRLVFADFLEERGDGRAELLRIDNELQQLSRCDVRREKLLARHRKIVKDHGAFFDPKSINAKVLDATGGFVRAIELSYSKFIRNQKSLFEAHPIQSVSLTGRPKRVHELIESPFLSRISELHLYLRSVSEAEMIRFVASPEISHLRALSIYGPDFQTLGVTALAQHSHLRQLRSLDLACDCADIVTRLANSSVLPPLWRMSTTESLPQLEADFAGPVFSELREFESRGTMTPSWHSLALASGATLERLRIQCSPAPWGQPQFPQLQQCYLHGAKFTESTLSDLLANSPQLCELELRKADLTDACAQVIAASPVFQQLQRLGVSGNAISYEGAKALGASPHRTRSFDVFLEDFSPPGAGDEVLSDEDWDALADQFGKRFGNRGRAFLRQSERTRRR